MTHIYKLTGTPQHYVWGGKDYIPELLGVEKTQPYYAEWWLGAHTSSPSNLEIDGKNRPLTDFIAENPQVLGQSSLEHFGKELPYLLKILDVAKPLSIQLHPTKQQAEEGFAKENAAGIDLKDPTRTYKDRNHKPEMMIALSDFWLLHGFRPKAEMLDVLSERPSLADLAKKLENQDIATFYAEIMQADQLQLSTWLNPIIESNKTLYQQQKLSMENPDYWVLYTLEAMEISPEKLDAGLICFYLFNIVHVKKGEGIFQDAGIPHAYLRGQNIELMACSDNVIRGGLTPKHIDIPELLRVVDCREVIPQLIDIADENQAIFTYATPAKDFALSQICYQPNNKFELNSSTAEILFVMQGELKITAENTELTLKQGESAFIGANSTYQLEGCTEGYAVSAHLPK